MLSLRSGEDIASALDALRRRCLTLHYANGAPPLSFSAGIQEDEAEDLEGLLYQADRYLYQAKHKGRGQTVFSGSA